MKITKTNAMRQCDTHKINYQIYTYDTSDGHIDGISVANKCNQDPAMVYKTLVTIGQSKKIYVFVNHKYGFFNCVDFLPKFDINSAHFIHLYDLRQ